MTHAQDQTTSSLTVGALLRKSRHERGLSIADIATVTRIPRNMLEHLERDRFGEYTASVFTRGHLMNFAREVGLDPEYVLRLYEVQTGETRPSLEFEPPVTPPKTKAPRTTPKRAPSSSPRHAPLRLGVVSQWIKPVHMAALLLLLGALFAGAFFLNGSSATAQNPASFSSAPDAQQWSLEEEAEQTRWFLEQPASTTP